MEIEKLVTIHEEIEQLAIGQGFKREVLYDMEPCPIVVYTRSCGISGAPSGVISAGIHGDEPAGVYAVKSFLEQGSLDQRYDWTIFPIMNPSGLVLGTRENSNGVDLNRQYKEATEPEIVAQLKWLESRERRFDLAMKLHEDWEGKGFYMYAIEHASNGSVIAPRLIESVRAICPIEYQEELDGFEIKDGLICPNGRDIEQMQEWPEAIYYVSKYKPTYNFTFETPSGFPLLQRVRAQVMAIEAAQRLAYSHLTLNAGKV